jgi:hypothetical protein
LVIRVYQLPRLVRVPPQARPLLTYSVRVHVWPMYSLAIQRVVPSTAAAP